MRNMTVSLSYGKEENIATASLNQESYVQQL